MTIARHATTLPDGSSETLDPQDWDEVRVQAHRMLDDMLDYVANVRERPVWRPIPDEVRARFRESLPRQPSELADVYREFTDYIAPYATGNVHPGFMGWVHGGGNVAGMLAEMLAAGLNANCGGRDHVPIDVERQIVEWTRQMFGFPNGASGIFVTGTSMANLMAVLVARTEALGQTVRQRGVADRGARLVAYTSAAAHGCIAQAMDLSAPHEHRRAARADRARSRARSGTVPPRRLRRHCGHRRD
jgi:aromatic-L-amino-acid decarboxylase